MMSVRDLQYAGLDLLEQQSSLYKGAPLKEFVYACWCKQSQAVCTHTNGA